MKMVLNLLKVFFDMIKNRRLGAIAYTTFEDLPELLEDLDCDEARRIFRDAFVRAGFSTRDISIIAEPTGQDLGHLWRANQFQHEVLEVNGKVFDPYRRLPPSRIGIISQNNLPPIRRGYG